MKHQASPRFWQAYANLPADIQRLADRNYQLWLQNPLHLSLHFKKVGGRFWSARVGLHYRALGVEADDTLVWFWIGSHGEYDRLIR